MTYEYFYETRLSLSKNTKSYESEPKPIDTDINHVQFLNPYFLSPNMNLRFQVYNLPTSPMSPSPFPHDTVKPILRRTDKLNQALPF